MVVSYFTRCSVAAVILCALGVAVYSLLSLERVGPEGPPSDVPRSAEEGSSEEHSAQNDIVRTQLPSVERRADVSLVKLVDAETSWHLAGIALKAPSLEPVVTEADGTVELKEGQQYRFSSPQYGRGVIQVSGEEGESVTVVRVRPLHGVFLSLSESTATQAGALSITLQYMEQRLPYAIQVGEYSTQLRAGEISQLRMPRGRWRVRAESGAKIRPHVIDTSRDTRFELSLLNGREHSLGGIVRTSAGEPCPGAKVQVLGRALHATSDEDGRFLVRDCPPVLSLRVVPHDSGLEPLVAGPFAVGQRDLVLTVQNALANVLTVRSRDGTLIPDAVNLHYGAISTECLVSGDGSVKLPRMLTSADAVEVRHSSLGAPVFFKEWTEERDEAAGQRRYVVSPTERDILMRIYDAGTMGSVIGCRVTLVSAPNGLVGGAASGATPEFASGLRKSVVHGSYKTDVEGIVVLRGVVGDSMYAKCRFDGYEDVDVRLPVDGADLLVPLHRTIRVDGRVLTSDAIDGWVCSVRLAPVDGAMPTEVLVKQGRFGMRTRSGRYRVGVRLGPSIHQLAPIDKGLLDIYESQTLDIDLRDAEPVKLRFAPDPTCVRGPALGDSVTVQGVAGADPVIRVNNGSGMPEPVLVFPGEYYVWISGRSDETGDQIVSGKVVRVYAGAEEVVVPIGFSGKKMLLRAAVPAAHVHATYARLPDWSYVQFDAEGSVMLPQELPEGAPVQLCRNVGGKWVGLGESMRVSIEGETAAYTIARVQ